MLGKLEYTVTFPSTGRTFNETVLFQGGFGAIVGPNESGKSLILEMVRFCLFGSAALRGRADDYKTLKAELDFHVRGEAYLSQRTATKATLSHNGEVIAVGIKPVNLKIAQILGFGLDVFDMACVANQDELTSLGSLPPTERRRRVDSVIGVAILDDLAKQAGDEATANRRAADDLAANATEPTVPNKPHDYQPSADLVEEMQQLDKIRSEADQLRGWLATERTRPEQPTCDVPLDSSEIQELLDEQNRRKNERSALEAELNRIPPAANITLEEIEADEAAEALHGRYLARRKFLTYHTQPVYTAEQLSEMREEYRTLQAFKTRDHLEEQKQDLLKKGHHECPSCSHQWPIAGDQLSKIEEQIEAYDQLINLRTRPTPKLTPDEIERHQKHLDTWDEAEWQKHADAPTAPVEFTMTVQDRIRHRHGLEGKARRAELIEQIEKLKPTEKEPDYAGMLRKRQQYEAQLSVFATQLEDYQAWETEFTQKSVKLAMLEIDLQDYEFVNTKLAQARLYEQAMVVYETQLEVYNRVAVQVAKYRADAEDWAKVKEAMKILRLKIKQHLVPSLNRVASSLITHMTGGSRQTITVDEEFNITVDGQAIDTLSGSGKAVANLALRIGLGQVLTNNVFSLFMGDEIDASMDKDRAEKTSGVLYTLKGRISQLLLVSHKFPSADYYIAVGEQGEQLYHTDP